MSNSIKIENSENLLLDENQAILVDRVNIYGMLRLIFANGPSLDFFTGLKELKIFSSEIMKTKFYTQLKSLQKISNEEGIDNLTQLQTEFTRLFIGPGKAPAYPYECVYRSPHGTLMQKITSEVRKFYLDEGLIMQRLNSIPDDHLGAELEFLLYMGQQMVEYPDRIQELSKTQLDFMQKHILTWTDDFSHDILTNTNEKFFKNLALVLKNFMHWDENFLAEIIIKE
jgi:TorA maturation chaperone TorD